MHQGYKMPKLNHLLLLALVGINISTINAMDQKDIVIALSDSINENDLETTFDKNAYKTFIIRSPEVTTTRQRDQE